MDGGGKSRTDTPIQVHSVTPIYLVAVFLLYACYFIVYFKIYAINPNYIRYLSTFIHIFICVFLLIRFNPFSRTFRYHQSDGIIVFGSATILLTNVVATEVGLGTFVSKHSPT